ncbi:hypothetical protein A2572_01050, partial [Candidatus Collierbacteria bacterium RIFOXYD1_FULL_40_9]
MLKKLWVLLKPFHKAFYLFAFIAFCYEVAQMAASYVISLVVTLFDANVSLLVWAVFFVGLLIFDEFNMRLDNTFDWHVISKHSFPLYKFFKFSAIVKFLKLDTNWHKKNNSGTLVGKVGNGVWKTMDIIDAFSWEFLPTIIQTVVSLVPLLIITPWVALVSLIAFSIFAWITNKGNKLRKPLRSKREDYYEEEWRQSVASVQSVETVAMFGQQQKVLSDQEHLHDSIIEAALNEFRRGVFVITRWRIRTLTIARRIILAIWLFQLLSGTMSIPNLIFVSVLVERLFASFWRFARLLDRAAENQEGAERLINLLQETEPVETGQFSLDTQKALAISLKDVCFAYDGDYSQKDGALHNLNLEIPAGQIVALVGPSGAGKTTIRKVITRSVSCQQGEITVGGININDWDSKSLVSQFSYVPQGDEVYIYDETIYYNITFANPDATAKEVENAAKLAGIYQFIASLGDRFNTKVGERGIRLSGGQKQRIALARAILADRPILILDEATSAVDAITENEIQTNMRQILKGKTAIVIAHRLSTVWNLADKIVVMDEGKIIEEGTHQDLVDKSGLYAKMVKLQS